MSSSSSPSLPHRVANFNAGPGCLPLSVLKLAQSDMLNYKGSGMSVMEMSHRSKEFEAIIAAAQRDLRALLNIPNEYRILFLQGGATTQFAAIPINLLGTKKKSLYLVTGAWSKAAADEAKKYCDVKVAATNEGNKHKEMPTKETYEGKLSIDGDVSDFAYFHYCHNETVHGLQFHHIPNVPSTLPLIADYSSCFCSEPIDVSRYALIYAGVQKNLGPAGVTIVIVKSSMLTLPKPSFTPLMLNYEVMAEKDSMYNTPPCWSIYMTSLVIQWILKDEGGLEEMAKKTLAKSSTLYDFIDTSPFYECIVKNKEDRSYMNVVFDLKKKDLLKVFVEEAEREGLVGIAGHRSVGGCRASLYNAVTLEDVAKLISFMKKFEHKHSQ